MPVGATKVKYIEALEDNTGILYPALALLALVLIALGILQALRTDDMDAVVKAELKREIIRELRIEIHGMTAELLAKKVNQPSHRLAKLLEEMVEAGMVERFTDTRRITTWRVKGLRG
jgi:predicted transcriptional regulator